MRPMRCSTRHKNALHDCNIVSRELRMNFEKQVFVATALPVLYVQIFMYTKEKE